METLRGWFFEITGDGYGPYTSRKKAMLAAKRKSFLKGTSFLGPYFATVEVHNRRLIEREIHDDRIQTSKG